MIFFKCFVHIRSRRPSWSCDQCTFYKSMPLRMEALHKMIGKAGLVKRFENNCHIHVITPGQGHTAAESFFFSKHKSCQFGHVFPLSFPHSKTHRRSNLTLP